MTEFQATRLAATPSPRGQSLRIAMVLLVLGAILAIGPFVENEFLYLNVAIMGFLAFAPAWYLWRAGELDVFEPIHVVAGLYFVYFGLGAIWLVQSPRDIALKPYLEHFSLQASFICLLALLALQVGWRGILRNRVRSGPTELIPRNLLFVLLPGIAGLAGHFAQFAFSRGIMVFGGLTTSVVQLQQFFMLAWGLTWLLVLTGRVPRHQRYGLLLTMVPAAGIVAIFEFNNKSLLLVLLGVPLVAWWYARRRVPWVQIVAILLLLVFVIFPFNNLYRTYDPNMGVSERMNLTYGEIANWSFKEYWRRSATTFQARVALINPVAAVVRETGRTVPFAHGDTLFTPMLVMLVPRPLWPDKPLSTFGRDFGRLFRLVHLVDDETTIASTTPGELYWNFGPPGVVLGMVVLGFGLRLTYRRYGESTNLDPVNRAIQIVLLVQIVHWGGGLAAELAGMLRTLLMFEGYRMLGSYFGLLKRVPAFPLYGGRGRSR